MAVIEYSSMCFDNSNYYRKITEAKELVEANGFDFGVQIHNSIERELFDKILALKDQIKISVHSPVFSKYFLNLASNDNSLSIAICGEAINYLKMVNTDIFFFHGFFMTDKPIVHDMKNYRKTMFDGIGKKFSLNNSFIMNPDYFETDEYLLYKDNFKTNLEIIKSRFQEYDIVLENDFVGIGSGLQRPKEIIELIDNLWFDLGHFWCSSLLHKFDYYEMADYLIENKKIYGVHINHNLMKHSDRLEDIKDSHTHLYEKSEQNLKPLLRKLLDRGNKIFTLEIIDGDLDDIKILLDYLN